MDNSLAALSIAQLTDRLAEGFETLRELQGLRSPLMTKPSHGISISPVVEQGDEMVFEEAITHAASADSAGAQKTDMDAALRAALGTLEAMTEQSRRAS
ncbi:MAG: hypothetical protein U5J78_00565 [Parasphingorhabdus sp.]|nr:hypothetical protein [Parasphingorhabdus sp.]